MKYRKKDPRLIDRKTYEQLASTGFIAALGMYAHKVGCTELEAVQVLSKELGRDPIQVSSYKTTGLPDYLIEPVLNFLKKHDIAFGCHQLRPNSSMVKQAFLDRTH